MPLVNAKEMVKKAHANKYAVPQFNINNLEWTKVILETCQEQKSPVILGVSGGASKYMGGFLAVSKMVSGLVKDLNISIPVALHIDHGHDQECQEGIDNNFTSIMFDGSHLSFTKNLERSKHWVKEAKKLNISVECEVGAIGGEEDGIVGDAGELADPEECKEMAKIGVDFLAAGIGNIHGPYPKSWKSLNFEVLEKLQKATNNQMPFVLHGGSGIPDEQVKKAISLGVAKINVNTELQLAFTKGMEKYFANKMHQDKKGYDPRKSIGFAMQEVAKEIINKISVFGSKNKI